ncbi:Ankyrin repeat domain-containing protein 50 [Dermatophagoides farinae]|uniref:Ankyrin repeat domain-containing protein 50 n=2 Tax=Pyroglyphidae TaxID=6952 RepID=A0A922HR90_DERFA|nr:Ankyrin repeat domain-containing protein 50 [Dermatophagoides farinae]
MADNISFPKSSSSDDNQAQPSEPLPRTDLHISDSELETNLQQIRENNDIIWRDWFFNKIEKILDISNGNNSIGQQQQQQQQSSQQQPTIKNVTVIFGQAGSGKTFLIQLLSQTKRFQSRVLMSFYCKFTSSTPNDFIDCFDQQIQQIFSHVQKSSSLATSRIIDTNNIANHSVNFRENLLKLLNSFSKDLTIVNKYQLQSKRYLLLIDSIDLRPDICDLVASNLHSLPNWLHVIITARPKRYRGITKMFSGARKIVIDDIKKSNVYNDIMGYLCKHQTKIQATTASATTSNESSQSSSSKHLLNRIVHKSNGSILYVKILLDCFERKIFDIQQLDFVGATLNGLYLALFTNIFNNNPKWETEFKTIFSSIDRINSFKVSVADLLTKLQCSEETLNQILNVLFVHHLILYTDNDQSIKLIHGSLFEWLSDIKHCTARFICRSYFPDTEQSHLLMMNLSEQVAKNRQLALAISNKYIQDNDDSINDISDDMLYERDRSDSQMGTTSGQAQVSTNSNNKLFELQTIGIYAEANYSHIDKFNNNNNDKNLTKTNSIEQEDLGNNNKKYNGKLSLKFDSTLVPNDSQQHHHHHHHHSSSFINSTNLVESTTSNSLKDCKSKPYLPMTIDDDCLVDSDGDEQQNPLVDDQDLSKTEISKEYLNKLYQKFEQALHLCDLKALRSILSRYGNVIINQNFINGKTPMYWAIKKGNMKLVELFLEFNADVNAVCDPQWGYSSLILALMQHSFDMCELLLENDADVELLDRYSMPPILHAILVNCSPEIIKLLLYWGSHTDFIDETGRSLLHFAANEPKTWGQTISLLLTVGCDEMHRDNNGQTALHMAAANGSLETVEVLVEFGGDKLIHTQDKSGKLAIHEAVAKNNFEVCEPLITPKSINFAAHSGNSPLRIAILSYYLDLAQLLILKGADVNYKDADGRSIIYCVVAFTHSTLEQKGPPFFNLAALYKNGPEEYLETAVKTIEFLARFGIDLEIKDLEGRTALHVAAWQGTYAIVDCLIKLGTNIDAIDAEGRTPLHMCAWNGHIEVLRLLIESGAMVNPISSTQGASPLLVAAQQGHYETCAYLLQAGSDISHRDFYGRNAKDVALNCGHKEIVQLIDSFVVTTVSSVGSLEHNQSNNDLPMNHSNDHDVMAIKYSKYDARFYGINQSINNSNNQNLDNNNGIMATTMVAINNTNSVPNNHNINNNNNNKKGIIVGSRKSKKTRSISKLTKMLH